MTHVASRFRPGPRVPDGRRLAGVGLALGFVLGGCGAAVQSAPATSGAGSPSVTSPVTPTGAPSEAPPATQAAPPEPCTPQPECQVPAGIYHADGFDGGMTFRIHGDVWTNVTYQAEMLSLHIAEEWVVFMSGEVNVRTGDGSKLTADPAVARRTLGKLPGIEVTPIDETAVIDGAEAVVFEVANAGKGTATLWSMGHTSAIYSLDPGSAVRVYWVDRDGTPFLLALEATSVRLPVVVEDAQVVVDNIAFD
jgi:hypothetical protein